MLFNRIVLEKTERYCRINLLHYGYNFQAALNCVKRNIKYDSYLGTTYYDESTCTSVANFFKCFSKIQNAECNMTDILSQVWDRYPLYQNEIKLRKYRNMCGDLSSQSLAAATCVTASSIFYVHNCGMMELYDCE